MNFDLAGEAERTVLGAILLEPKAYDEAMSLGLEEKDFCLSSHRTIFRHLVLLAGASSALDAFTLIMSLSEHKELAGVGDVGYVSGLTDGVPDRPTIKSYVRIVQEYAARRGLMSVCSLALEGLSQEMKSPDAISLLSDQMLQIQTGSSDTPARRVIEFSDETYTQWLKVAESGQDLIGLPTGVSSVDLSTTGIRDGELWVDGGRTGDGKTNLGLQVAAANCREDRAVAIFSPEMPKETLLQRLWAGEGQVDYKYVRFPRLLRPDVKMRIHRAMCDVGKWPLHIVEDSGITLPRLIAKAKLLIRREAVKLIIVDYVQVVGANGRDERERVTKISKGLQQLAKDTGVPVFALSQLSRPKEGNENNRPTKYNLKESGSLENDADVIVLIFRPVDDRKQKTNIDELIIDKQRNGMPSIENVTFLPWLRFGERMTA